MSYRLKEVKYWGKNNRKINQQPRVNVTSTGNRKTIIYKSQSKYM